MLITIAVCSYNKCESLRQTLASLGQVCVPPNLSCEIIVVDNASTDSTSDVVGSCRLPNMSTRYVFESRRGLSHARNRAVAEAQGEIILFTDDDVRPPRNWISEMCQPLLSGRADAAVGGVKIAPHLNRPWMGKMHRAWLTSTEGFDAESFSELIGANMGISAKVLAKVPGFDPALGAGAMGFYEDTLFSFQLIEAGYHITAAFDAVAEHHFDESRLLRSSLLGQSKKKGRSLAYLDYHWEHRLISLPQKRLAEACLRLVKWRIKRRQECESPEGMPEWEMRLVKQVAYYQQYLIERKHQPKYAKHGLKLSASDEKLSLAAHA